VANGRALATAAAILLFAFIGLTLPDVDQPLPLDHRSAVTHSILPAAVALLRRWARPIAAGLAFGIGLHLSADVFPNAMIGYATVKLPLAGSIGPGASYAWLAINSVACTILGAWLVGRELSQLAIRRLLLAAMVVLGAAYLLATDGGWAALGVYGLAGWLFFRRRERAKP
jgi:hypothetical protein